MPSWIQSWVQNNKIKSWILIFLFPAILWIVIFCVCYIATGDIISIDKRLDTSLSYTGTILLILIPILIVRLLIAFYYEKSIMFSFSWAEEVKRKDYPELYNIVENLCISRWLATPKIGIIEDEWMNAFALWWNSKDSRICFTKGLIRNLNKKEIESVAWHELTHIINKDCLLMAVIILYIWAISTLWGFLVRNTFFISSDENKKSWNIAFYLWIALILLGYIFYPITRLAISRKREFLADAGSVLLTQDKESMISALKKISKNSEVQLNNESVASLFIANPLSKISNLFKTHPSIEDRIKALENY